MVNPLDLQNPIVAWLTVIGFIAFMVIVVVIELFYRERRKAFIGKWIGNVFTAVQTKRLSPLQKSISIGIGKTRITIPIDMAKPTLVTKRKTWIYCVDFDTHTQTGFSKNDFSIDGDFYDTAFAKGGIKHMVSGMARPQIAGYIMYIIIGIAIGLPTGILIQIIAKLGA
jgi:hypothetical protein